MIQGKAANERNSPEQLAETIKAWERPHTSGPLTEQELKQFWDKGFVIKHDVIPDSVLLKAISSIEELVDGIADRLHRAGKITDPCSDAGFHNRLIKLDEQFQHTNVLLHKNGVLPTGVQGVWAHSSLINIARQILGWEEDIMGHPVWNLRCKTPEKLSHGQATVPWHQDNSYLDEECWDKLQVTAWVPLLDTNLDNGCMQVVSGAHKPGLTVSHACCVGGTWYTECLPQEIEATLGGNIDQNTVTCEVPFGSVLLLNNIIPHRSLENFSQGVRWSLDLRWQRGDEPNGFHGLKDSLLMVPANSAVVHEGEYPVCWDGWAEADRTEAQFAALTLDQASIIKQVGEEEGRIEEEFDTTIAGPWMHRWPLVHHNRHTANLPASGGMHGWGSHAGLSKTV